MKSSIKWPLLALALAAVAVVGWRINANTAAHTAQAAQAAQNISIMELSGSDVSKVEQHDLARSVPISGTLKAENSALVKARIAGELQGLSLREGDLVRAGQMIARIDATEAAARVRQAREQADAAKAQIDIAQRQFDNNKALTGQGFISQTALDISQANLNAMQATHKAALAALDVAHKSLDDTVLKAPISGVVAQRLAQNGERVGVDARVLEIVDLSRLELEAALTAADSVDVRIGQRASLSIEGQAAIVQARVLRINPSATAGSRQVLVYLGIVPDEDRQQGQAAARLRQGLFAQGRLQLASSLQLAVPLADVRNDKPQPYVALIEEGRVKHQTVELGERGQVGSDLYVAIKPVAKGATLMRASAGQLRDGTAVKLVKSSD